MSEIIEPSEIIMRAIRKVDSGERLNGPCDYVGMDILEIHDLELEFAVFPREGHGRVSMTRCRCLDKTGTVSSVLDGARFYSNINPELWFQIRNGVVCLPTPEVRQGFRLYNSHGRKLGARWKTWTECEITALLEAEAYPFTHLPDPHHQGS